MAALGSRNEATCFRSVVSYMLSCVLRLKSIHPVHGVPRFYTGPTQLHCDSGKSEPKCFCYIFHKTHPILMKFGTEYLSSIYI